MLDPLDREVRRFGETVAAQVLVIEHQQKFYGFFASLAEFHVDLTLCANLSFTISKPFILK